MQSFDDYAVVSFKSCWTNHQVTSDLRCLTLKRCHCNEQRSLINNGYSTLNCKYFLLIMMMSSNGYIFCVTGHLCGEFTGHQWIPRTKASDAELWCFILSVPWINGWVNNGEAGDLRRHHAHYDVTVMACSQWEHMDLPPSYVWYAPSAAIMLTSTWDMII